MSDKAKITSHLKRLIMSKTLQNQKRKKPKLEDLLPDEKDEWILALLHAPDENGQKNQPVPGIENVVQSLFLIHRRLAEMDEESPFEYSKTKYGPVDDDVSRDFERLQDAGKIERQSGSTTDGDQGESYSLTAKGEEIGKQVYNSLPIDIRGYLNWVRKEHTEAPLGELRTFLYSEDSTMFK